MGKMVAVAANGKRVLVIGSGGREHAICWKLAQSPHVERIYALPGSFGIAQVEKCENLNDVSAKDFNAIAAWCKNNKIDLVAVGPEDPLAQGLGDVLTAAGVRCFGPGKQGAQIEADKKWSKDFMQRHNIPTARYESFTDTAKAKAFIRSAPYKALVVKAAGLAAGKGVVVADNVEAACQAVDEILGDKKYGNAGETLVIEELLSGEEISVLAFVDGECVQAMLPAQDHKRLGNGDAGPNTGGMGAYCPCPLISDEQLQFVQHEVLERTIAGLRKEQIHYVGVLYAGLMLTPDGPRVLEFNCRFGDPETQVVLPLLASDLYEVMSACCDKQLRQVQLAWQPNLCAVGVIMASAGYPETSTKGCVIKGLPSVNTATALYFHSGVAVNKAQQYLTNGGRVLIAVALHAELKQAASNATSLCQKISFSGPGNGAQYRTDIAAKAFQFAPEAPALCYKDSGVDIDAGDDLVQRIKPLSIGTRRAGVIGGIGGFGGLFRLKELDYKQPVLCEATSSVGSKIGVALEHKLYESIGYDLFAMCCNDVLEAGAEPIAFLDYIACGKLEVPVAAQIVKGITAGCRSANCALVGGETAEMPSVYQHGKYDIAGYCVGIVEHGQELPNFTAYREGDLLIALPSSGLHCAGYTEVLRQLRARNIDLHAQCEISEGQESIAQILGKPTRAYASAVLPLVKRGVVKSIAHITHGLLTDVSRIVPREFDVALDFGDLKVPPVFSWLTKVLELQPATLTQHHNCGIGMVMVVDRDCMLWKTAIAGSKVLGVLKRAGSQQRQLEVRNFEDCLDPLAHKYDAFGHNDLGDVLRMDKLQRGLTAHGGQLRSETYQRGGRRLTRVPDNYTDPILIMGTDGVGTKIKIAQQTGKNDTVGIDLVAMCVNDIICNGAEPYTFSSYYACGELQQNAACKIVKGIAAGANKAHASLIDTHLAELPLLYSGSSYDLAGFSLGIAEHARLLPKTASIVPGDVLIGLPSSGVHSNGFSLVHAVMQRAGVSFADKTPFSTKSYGEEFLAPTKIYVQALAPLIAQPGLIKALAHITGGGLTENIPRVLSADLAAQLDAEQFVIPPVFGWLAAQGNIVPAEMQRTFNCGIGMLLIVAVEHAAHVLAALKYTERAAIVGQVIKRDVEAKAPKVLVNNFAHCLQRVQRLIRQPLRRIGVLISGSGTNLQALIDASRDSSQCLHAEIVLVISNKSDVLGLKRAEAAGIPTVVLPCTEKPDKREPYGDRLTQALRAANVDIVCLAGFMVLLPKKFVEEWRGRLINIHPSLLPKHKGTHGQRQALLAGDRETGCTVHFVDVAVDSGAHILQERGVPILEGDTEESLTERLLKAEHYVFPKALRLLTNGLVKDVDISNCN